MQETETESGWAIDQPVNEGQASTERASSPQLPGLEGQGARRAAGEQQADAEAEQRLAEWEKKSRRRSGETKVRDQIVGTFHSSDKGLGRVYRDEVADLKISTALGLAEIWRREHPGPICPVRFRFFDYGVELEPEERFKRNCTEIRAELTPQWKVAMRAAGLGRVGRRVYLGDLTPTVLRRLMAHIPGEVVSTRASLEAGHKAAGRARTLRTELDRPGIDAALLEAISGWVCDRDERAPAWMASTAAVIHCAKDKGTLEVRVVLVADGSVIRSGRLLDQFGPGTTSPAAEAPLAATIEAGWAARAAGFAVGGEFGPARLGQSSDELKAKVAAESARLRRKLETLAEDSLEARHVKSRIAWLESELEWRLPNVVAHEEARGRFDEGVELVRRSVTAQEIEGIPGMCYLAEGQAEDEPVLRRRIRCALGVEKVAEARAAHEGAEGWTFSVAPRVADEARMASAEPSSHPGLLPPQRRVVGAHLVAEYGMLDASQTGTGKTVNTLVAQRQLAERVEAFRVLNVVRRSMIGEWLEHAAEWFPEARVHVAELARTAEGLVSFERETGADPGLVLAAYEVARRQADALAILTYDEIAMDEADVLCNPNAQLSKAMWRLRQRARLGCAITATPMNKHLSEVDAILAWTRDDPEGLRKRRIGNTYAGLDTLSRERRRIALGAALQRIEFSEIGRWMAEVRDAEHRYLDPTGAEERLAVALMSEVAELYAKVKERAETASRAGSADAEEARKALASATGLCLSTVTLAHEAAVDPEGLLSSNAKAAALVVDKVDAAVKAGPTKRDAVCDIVAEAVGSGEQVHVHSMFSRPLRLLARELEARHGIDVGLFTGDTHERDREVLKQRFRAGDLPVMLLGKVGVYGVNVQGASVVVHYDLPWVPKLFTQRTGRATRLMAGVDGVFVMIPTLRGTIEESVARRIVPRAAEALATLKVDQETPDSLAVSLEEIAAELGEEEGASLRMQIAAELFSRYGLHKGKRSL